MAAISESHHQWSTSAAAGNTLPVANLYKMSRFVAEVCVNGERQNDVSTFHCWQQLHYVIDFFF
jgi:hypothetical protein